MKRLSLFIIIAIFASAIIYTSCKKDKEENETPVVVQPTQYGIVKGTVVSQNETPIGGAKVFVENGSEIILVLSDENGNFELEVPAGQRVINIQTGKGNIFRSDYIIDVIANTDNFVPTEKSMLNQVADLAYIAGAYDEIEALIIDSLGYTATEITVNDLADLATIEQYSGIFLNCGKSGLLDAQKYTNLEQFVADGGSLYASDWAVEYLTGDGNAKSFELIDRDGVPEFGLKSCTGDAGGFIDDNILCTQKIGPVMTISGASIIATDIQNYLGQSTVDVEYDLGSWEQIEILDNPWEVLIEDQNTGYGPLAIRLAYGNLNSTKAAKQMNEQGWITICHIPPGNPNNPITITVSINSWPAHQAHGDPEGPCAGTGGTIYYTTFHNHAQGNISFDVQKLLEYFILNL